MIYYSAFPLDLAYYDPSQIKLEEMTVDGITMLVNKQNEGEATLVRLISPDPAHYLDPRYQPGMKITNQPRV
ncbi:MULTISPECIES: YlzJ-like family protein [Thermoactinomyces]|jgi:hypothetical protein|uniref:YlzJ-like family protein n=1 Tax=Thermoactinomyces daqus TaxID=1329516 RepID=A0A7W1X925_9BACL|nr:MULTISPECIES: YlzJ-like family protein [Thermoactinomyces]MBA4542272.1 YlzJ-like family protein [Thermoactinomyces daqus]MBH8598277.1 YlzJ-like family protein [Thermoactinomyces sp. CICC 10523]MBH8604400.1 YlzJ-like family protein [Thermoactinomyces sp. CICC 10522]MBH8608485.1 YlzJ-like family protein [Thermoactinomyces sp. CICC 10521]